MLQNLQTLNACDRVGLTARTVTEEGFLKVPSNLARTGVQEYRAYELGLDADGMDPMKVIRLHRPAEEVFDADSMSSFESKPVTVGHPDSAVTSENWSDIAVGEVCDIRRAGDHVAGTVIIKARSAIDAVEAGTVELSNGYTFTLDWTAGTADDGERYDGVQRNIRGNHVALVDAARCGSTCRLGDALHSSQDGGDQLTGRGAFMQRQQSIWKRYASQAADGKSDATELDENSVARPDQTTGGLIAIAKQNAKNKAKASAAPTGRDLFMQRTSQAWRNEGAA